MNEIPRKPEDLSEGDQCPLRGGSVPQLRGN